MPASSAFSVVPVRCRWRPSPSFGQASISRSWIELYWSACTGMMRRSIACSSQVHWNTAASNIEVGVSALYSSSFAGPLPVEAEVDPAVEAGLVAVPAFRDQRPEGFRDLQAAQIFLVVDRAGDEFDAHGVYLGGRQPRSGVRSRRA